MAAAAGILPDGLSILFLSRRQDADECGLEAARSRRKSGAAAECAYLDLDRPVLPQGKYGDRRSRCTFLACAHEAVATFFLLPTESLNLRKSV